MACFIVPATEAIVTTIASKIAKKKENNTDSVTFTNRLNRLNGLLWGGSGLLAFEHLWHGEIQPFFPFLTAAATPESTRTMLFEMSTSGVAMAVVVTIAWAGSVIAEKMIKQKSDKEIVEAGS